MHRASNRLDDFTLREEVTGDKIFKLSRCFFSKWWSCLGFYAVRYMKTDVETSVHYTAQTPRISSSPELMRGWGKLHNGCLPNLYLLEHIITKTSRRIRWVGHVARNGDNKSAYNVLVGKSEGNGLLGRCTRWWVEYKQTEWEYVGWIYLAQARDQWQITTNAKMNL
jgi:hypothetical protein